jgi:PAS domain S-box-containing protein
VASDTIDSPHRPTRHVRPDALDQLDDPGWDGPGAAAAITTSALAVAQVDLATHRIVAASGAAGAMVGLDPADLVGRLVTDFVEGEATGGLPLLAAGRLEGFEAQRRLRRADGAVVDAYVWAHVLGSLRPARYGVAFLMDSESVQLPTLWLASPASDHKVIGTVDEEWRIDRISHEVRALLGYTPREVAGKLPMTSVNPHDLPQVLSGLAHVHATDRNVVVRARIRRADTGWVWCRAHLSAMGGAPRFAFTLRAITADEVPDSARLSSLESRLARIAEEVRSVAFSVPFAGAPALAEIPELADLTSREWQTLSLLADGGRVAGIAQTLGLSQSTVRNHLSAIYRKLDVRSQAELVDRLRSAG